MKDDMADEMQIDSNVRPPVAKSKKQKPDLFREYADAYEAVYLRRPVRKPTPHAGWFKADTLQTGVSAKRLRELIKMLKDRKGN